MIVLHWERVMCPLPRFLSFRSLIMEYALLELLVQYAYDKLAAIDQEAAKGIYSNNRYVSSLHDFIAASKKLMTFM